MTFGSRGRRCAGWLYRVPGASVPVVVLAHGFGLSRYAGLDRYARRFAAAGLAAFVFDYRHFGDSEGDPRQLIDVAGQLADWRAAVAHVRTLDGIDPDRVAIWGTSFSGGHVAALAAGDPRVAAVVSQVPFSGLAPTPFSPRRRQEVGGGRSRPWFLTRLIAAAVRDRIAGLRGRAHTIPLAGEPGTFAAFVEPGATAQLAGLHPPGYPFLNAYTPRVTLELPRYRPFAAAARIRCPWLVLVCDEDRITPAAPAVARSAPAPLVEVVRYAAGHFDVYAGALFERAVTAQTEFLRTHLLDPAEPPVSPDPPE